MKRTWQLVSTICFILCVMMALGLSWFAISGQLTRERLEAVRLAWDQQVVEDSGLEVESLVQEQGLEGSSERILAVRQASHREQSVDGQLLAQESRIRRRQIDVALTQLAEARKELEAEREAFEIIKRASAKAPKLRDSTQQFRRSVQLIESAQPLQAKIWLLRMIQEDRFDDAVAVLDAMRERSASRVLREFSSAQEMELAGKLLESLGRYGTSQDSPGASESSSRVPITDQPGYAP